MLPRTETPNSCSKRWRVSGAALVLAALLAGLLCASAVPATPGRAPRISLRLPSEVVSGSSVVVTGRTADFSGRGLVVLQSRKGKGWRSLVSGTLRRGRFRIEFVLGVTDGGPLRAVLFSGPRKIAVSPAKHLRLRSAEPAPAPPPEAPPQPAPVPSGPPEPSPLADYWGAWIGPQFTGVPAPEDMKAVSAFEGLSRKPLSILETFSSWADCSGPSCRPNQPFPRASFEKMRGYGAIPLYSWASEGNGGLDQPEFQLADIISGDFDSYIREWATEAKSWGHPFFLRFDWEMNGTWFPWSESADGNRPGELVDAWRHVHDVFSEVGATNVSWVWCPYVNPNGNLQSPATLYPGDAYVDWTGLDGYNRGTTASPTAQYRSFDFLFGPNYREITEAVAPAKPMLLAEVASSENGGSKVEWIRDMFAELPTAYPKVRGLMWFDYYDQGNDWPLETSNSATEAFASGISDPRYLVNSYGDLSAGPVPVP